MCYNKMYAPKSLTPGDIVISRMGHDSGKPFMVTAVLNKDFVLIADGKARTLEKPKTKRAKHLSFLCKSSLSESDINGKINDSAVRKELKTAVKNANGSRGR